MTNKLIAFVGLLPLVSVLSWLTHTQLIDLDDDIVFGYEFVIAIGAFLLVPIALCFGRHRPLGKQMLRLSPCFVGPVALVYPWTTVSIGFGGFDFFVTWLTAYPNFGPINYEVLGGMFCVMASVIVPAMFASYVLGSNQPRPWLLFTMTIGSLICWAAVICRLDYALLYEGLIGNFGPWQVSVGPLLRTAAMLTMAYWANRLLKQSTRRSQNQT